MQLRSQPRLVSTPIWPPRRKYVALSIKDRPVGTCGSSDHAGGLPRICPPSRQISPGTFSKPVTPPMADMSAGIAVSPSPKMPNSTPVRRTIACAKMENPTPPNTTGESVHSRIFASNVCNSGRNDLPLGQKQSSTFRNERPTSAGCWRLKQFLNSASGSIAKARSATSTRWPARMAASATYSRPTGAIGGIIRFVFTSSMEPLTVSLAFRGNSADKTTMSGRALGWPNACLANAPL